MTNASTASDPGLAGSLDEAGRRDRHVGQVLPGCVGRTIDLDQSVLASPFTKCSTSLRIGACARFGRPPGP